MAQVTDAEFRAVMRSFAAGVTVVTAVDAQGTPCGLTVTAFSSLSKDPPLCLVCVSYDSETYGIMRETGAFAVNMLGVSQRNVSTRFATQGVDKFEGIAWQSGEATGCPLLTRAIASIECRTKQVVDAGDHAIFIGLIESIKATEGAPLVYYAGAYCSVSSLK